ncbi:MULTISPECIES: D-arabinono-1,4-lactone oxidase [unclassified Microbacterium]|uniref:D-arabinono-1,4-lactone oxidase n=1 Tax=unclassified Microbacterium TaxID=2609290 RepID=UPI003018E8E8
MTTLRNWAGNLTYAAAHIARPASRQELADVIGESTSARVLGSRHSFNTIADTPGTLISLERMPRLCEIDRAAGVARVSGQLTYGEVARAVDAEGYALANMASLPHISVAGAVATGTHGSGDRNQGLAGAVRALTLMTADGGELTLRRGDPDFDGAVVNLGALGAVTDVELDLVPAFTVRQRVYEGARWDEVASDLDAVTSLGYSVSLFTTWRSADAIDQIWVKRVDSDPSPEEALRALGATPADGPRHPLPGVDASACTVQLDAPGPAGDRLPHFRQEFTPSNGDELQSEYLLPRSDAPDAIAALRALAGNSDSRIAALLQVCEIRTVAADELWLSPAFERDCVAFHFTWRPDQPAVEEFLPLLEAALPPVARPHWGKLHARTDLAPLYPRWADMTTLRDRLDPRRVFVNDHLARLGF